MPNFTCVGDVSSKIDLDEFLARPLFAHLSTTCEDGPRDSPVWFVWEEEHLWVLGDRVHDSFPKRFVDDPRCAIGIVDFRPELGFLQHVGFRGIATIEPVDVARALRLIRRYVGEGVDLRTLWYASAIEDNDPNTTNTIFVRFQPETVVIGDLSYSLDGRGLKGADVFS